MVAKAVTESGEYFCFHCGKSIQKHDIECNHCGVPLDKVLKAFNCPECSNLLPIGAAVCPVCKISFRVHRANQLQKESQEDEFLTKVIDWGGRSGSHQSESSSNGIGRTAMTMQLPPPPSKTNQAYSRPISGDVPAVVATGTGATGLAQEISNESEIQSASSMTVRAAVPNAVPGAESTMREKDASKMQAEPPEIKAVELDERDRGLRRESARLDDLAAALTEREEDLIEKGRDFEAKEVALQADLADVTEREVMNSHLDKELHDKASKLEADRLKLQDDLESLEQMKADFNASLAKASMESQEKVARLREANSVLKKREGAVLLNESKIQEKEAEFQIKFAEVTRKEEEISKEKALLELEKAKANAIKREMEQGREELDVSLREFEEAKDESEAEREALVEGESELSLREDKLIPREQKLEEMMTDLKMRTAEIYAREDEISREKAALDGEKSSFDSLRIEFEAEKAKLTSDMTELEAENEKSKAELESLSEKLTETERELALKEEKAILGEQKLEDMMREREDLAARLEKAEALKDDVITLLRALDQLLGKLPPEVVDEFSKSKGFSVLLRGVR